MSKIDEKLIVYESNPDFSDNSRGLYEYVKSNTDYQSFWIVRDRQMAEILKQKGVDCALEDSEEAAEMIRRAHFLVSSSFDFAWEKQPGQIHVSAWHGFPLKLIGFFDSASAGPDGFHRLKVMTTKSDIITASSKLSQLTIAGMFAVDPRKVKDIGFPRNDLMYREDARANLKKMTEIDPEESRLIFYLPTMRKGLKEEGGQFGDNFFNYDDYDADEIDEFLESKNAYLFAKVHFADNAYYEKGDFKLPKRLVFLNTELLNQHLLTIYHIMDAFDVLLTDYSSVYADFLLLNKPIVFTCPDMDQYQQDRGFVTDDPKLLMPGVIVKNQKELLRNLGDILNGKDAYEEERREKMPFFHRYQDADSGKRLFDAMVKADREGVRDSARILEDYIFAPSVHSYGREGNYEIFFDCGNGFHEQEKCSGRYVTEDDRTVSIEITLPAGTKAVRFDPDNVGRCQLDHFRVYVDGTESEFMVVNGAMVDGSIVFYRADPQIIIPVKEYATNIRIDYVCRDFYATGAKRLIEKHTELMEMKKTVSGMLKDLLRKLKKRVRQTGQ